MYGVELTWLDNDNLDRRATAGAVAVLEAARALDHPDRLSPTVQSFVANLQHGWDGDRPLVAITTDDRGRAIAMLEVEFPTYDNTHLAFVNVVVDPRVRRQGIGTRLFNLGIERARAEGRTLVLAGTAESTPGGPFLERLGFEPGSAEVVREQDFLAVDWPRLDKEYQEALPHAEGYELLRLAGPTPEDMLADIARMTEAINDAPIDALQIEDEVFSPQRVRAFEASLEAQRRRYYRVAARERSSGALAGHTMIAVEGERPWRAYQLDTSVVRAHRGHRLGLLLKIDMLRWLGVEEPQIQLIRTGNAASNNHMIGVNEILGYHVVAKHTEWQRRI
jgi:GNAT superfamily N-acetyltransferase